jgi:hypothetical protein
MNKLFISFIQQSHIESVVQDVYQKYPVYGKIFCLELLDYEEVVLSYSLTVAQKYYFDYTTLIANRHKDTNTIYTINALNVLVKALNGGIADPRYPINWSNYKNNILFTSEGDLKVIRTKLHSIW